MSHKIEYEFQYITNQGDSPANLSQLSDNDGNDFCIKRSSIKNQNKQTKNASKSMQISETIKRSKNNTYAHH